MWFMCSLVTTQTVSESPQKTEPSPPHDEDEDLFPDDGGEEVAPTLEPSDDLDLSPSKSSLEDRKPLFEERAL